MIEVISVLLTLAVFLVCKRIYKQWHISLLSPIFTSVIVVVCLLLLFHIPYSKYTSGAHIYTYLLQPATVAFAVPLYKNFKLLQQNWIQMIVSIFLGVMTAILTSFYFARLVHLNWELIESVVPRAITTPIAMDVSSAIGGSPILTSIFVIVTAFVGLLAGPLLVQWFHIKNPVAKGVLLGTSSHAAGTSRAFEYGEVEGAMSSISLIIAAIMTLFIAPVLIPNL